jgi:hypothetical protein
MLVVIVALVLPFVMSVWDVGYRRKLDSNPHVAEWIDQHIPAGTIVYMSQGIRDPLPTAESSAALWSEVANPDAWQQKFSSGLSRFKVSLSPDDYPRALSDANMRDERAFRREWFILGGHQDLAEPRYDVRLYSGQPVFGERDVSAAFAKTGGVLILDDSFGRAKQPAPGTPAVQWVDSKGDGVRVYCSADVKVSP